MMTSRKSQVWRTISWTLTFAMVCPLVHANVNQMGGTGGDSTSSGLLELLSDIVGDLRLYSTTAVSGGSSIPDTLIAVDPETGRQVLIGPRGQTNHVLAADIDPVSGYLFGVNFTTFPGAIERIEPQTGKAMIVATIRQSGRPVPISAVAFSPEGQLYGIAGSPGRTLGIVDMDAGTFLPMLELSDYDYIAGMDFSPEGTLYAVSANSEPLEQCVITIDTITREVTSVVRTGQYSVGDIDYAYDDSIYATNFSWALLRIDPGTGDQKVVGHGTLGALGGIASSTLQTARDVYVNAAIGDDTNDGLTPETALATIQRGVGATRDGDRVLIYPGLYREKVDFLGKAIMVQGIATKAGIPVLENTGGFAVSFYNGEGRNSVLANVVIRGSFIGIFVAGSSPTLRNLTLVDNDSGVEAYVGSEPDIANCIFWGSAEIDLFQCEARYSRLEQPGEGRYNISADPSFVDPDNGDYHLRSERGRYWPEHDVWVLDELTSPCVDGGDPNTPVGQERMPNGGRLNMGAYGGTPYASMSEMPCPPDGGSNQPPHVRISEPVDGASFYFTDSIGIVAEAGDVDGRAVKVEFFANGRKIGEDIDGNDGWTMEWTRTNRPSAEYELLARATDDDEASTESAPVRVTIRPGSRGSSRRYKTGIEDLEIDLEEVLKLRPVRFQWRTTGQTDVGLIAEEVAERLPDLVIYDGEGRPDGVQYEKLSVYLLGIIQTQQDRLAALEASRTAAEALERRVKALESAGESHTRPSRGTIDVLQ